MMGSYMRYGALAAKVKAMYGKRLRFSDFEQMAALPNEQSVLDYLRSQPGWVAAVAAMGSAGYVGRIELEESMRAQFWKEYEGLSHFVPKEDKSLIAFPLRLAELEDVLTALRRIKAGGRGKELPPRAHGLPLAVDRKALSACRSYESLLSAVKGSIYYEPLLHLKSGAQEELPDYTTAEALLRSTYFSYLYRVVHKNYAGETAAVLLRFLGEQVDMLNAIHILRLKTYFPGDDRYYSALFPFNYKLKPEKIKALCDAPDAAQVLTLLQDTPYGKELTAMTAADMEDFYRRTFYRFNKRQLVAFAPSIYTAVSYLNLKEAEMRVLINVVESVKYGVKYDESFARLVGE